jgi:hypothetical protein
MILESDELTRLGRRLRRLPFRRLNPVRSLPLPLPQALRPQLQGQSDSDS